MKTVPVRKQPYLNRVFVTPKIELKDPLMFVFGNRFF